MSKTTISPPELIIEIFDRTNFSEELHILLQLCQLLRSGWGLGVVIEDAAVEIQVRDLGEAAGQRHADIAQDDRPGDLLVEGRTLDPLDGVLNQRVILQIKSDYDLL